MSVKNPYTMPGNKGRQTHKRLPKQARTQREVKRIRAMRPRIIQIESDLPYDADLTQSKEADHA